VRRGVGGAWGGVRTFFNYGERREVELSPWFVASLRLLFARHPNTLSPMMISRRVTLLALFLLAAGSALAQEEPAAVAAAKPAPTPAPAALEKLDSAVEKTRAGIDKAANLVRERTRTGLLAVLGPSIPGRSRGARRSAGANWGARPGSVGRVGARRMPPSPPPRQNPIQLPQRHRLDLGDTGSLIGGSEAGVATPGDRPGLSQHFFPPPSLLTRPRPSRPRPRSCTTRRKRASTGCWIT